MATTSSPQDAADRFVQLVADACAAVDASWFKLPHVHRDGGDPATAARKAKYRERVYCYELYHQIRSLSERPEHARPGAPPYLLSGEIDKRSLGRGRGQDPAAYASSLSKRTSTGGPRPRHPRQLAAGSDAGAQRL